MYERLECLLHGLDCAVEGPDIGLEAEASLYIDLVLVVKENHSFTDVATSFPQPFLAKLGEENQNCAHLASFHNLDWDPIGVEALDLDHGKSPLCVRAKQSLLVLLKLALVHNAL